MTITPPPPTDLSGLVEAFAQTTGAVLDLAGWPEVDIFAHT